MAFLLPGLCAAEDTKSNQVTPSAKEVAASPARPELGLKEAMPADVVRHLMGRPEEIRPMKAANGRAEIWVYNRQVGERVDRLQIGSIPITETTVGADGQAHVRTVGETPQFADVRIVTMETVELLLFNDHYVTFKLSRHDVKHYS